MKKRLIQLMQRWTKTSLSPALDDIHWKLDMLNSRMDAMALSAGLQSEQVRDLATAAMFERWERRPTAIFSRAEFGYWLNHLGLFGEGVEIGVHRGDYSGLLLQTWKGRCLYSIDPWMEFSPDEYTDICNVSTTDQNQNHAMTVNRLAQFGSRSKILRQTSEEASEHFEEASLDFVYIDAQHHYEAVKDDLELWECKIKSGGVIGGHDYLDDHIESGVYGVKKAVDEWSKLKSYDVFVTREGPYPSWFVVLAK